MRILITGIAGFIGFHLAKRLHLLGHEVLGIDAFTSYYDISLKRARAAELSDLGIEIVELDLRAISHEYLSSLSLTHVVHLAAQAGVRFSLEQPQTYIDANISAFTHLLEWAKSHPTVPIIYASSSSVYGLNSSVPFKEDAPCNFPASPYAATKKAGELMAHAYHHIYGIPCIGLRFFTVYGPWGRPDMALYRFTEAMLNGKAIDVYNFGNMQRDFTYIDDIIDGIIGSLGIYSGYSIYNLGNNKPERLETLIEILEKTIGIVAIKRYLPMQNGDVLTTYADISKASHDLGFSPKTSIEEGIKQFTNWYIDEWRPLARR